ncbi:MAG: metallophosphoesterase [Bacteroidales bacterium]|jgi:predicted MPP superfamily phosphohydrolase|nr:metallophosphoesterase [Bacteroidales bacterium]
MIPIFSTRQILIISCIAGPMPASYLLANNLFQMNKKTAARFINFLGYFFALLIYIGFIFLDNSLIARLSYLQVNMWLGVGGAYFLIVALQSVITFFFYYKIKQINQKLLTDNSFHHRKIYPFSSVLPFLLLGLIITTYFMFSGTFRFMIFVIYALPNLYLYHRIKRIFNDSRSRLLFRVFFISWAALYPLLNLLHRYIDSPFFNHVVMVIDYYLPVMLYLFLFYLLIDLGLVILKKLKIISLKLLETQVFKLILFGAVMLLITVIMFKGIYNFNHTNIRQYAIEVNKKSSNPGQLKIAMAADFHLSDVTHTCFMHQFIEQINSIQPDIVLLIGDLVESDQPSKKMRSFEQQLQRIESRYGVFAVEGNHDIYRSSHSYDFIRNARIRLLQDTVITIDSSFQLAGRKDRHHRDRKTVEELLKNASDTLPLFLLDHQPYQLENAYENDVAIKFSGHTHHGQLFPLNYITEMIYELSWGHKKINDTHFFVTCGAQGWGPQVKTGSQSEIMEVIVIFR